jgi:gliding motility-associated-like protein
MRFSFPYNKRLNNLIGILIFCLSFIYSNSSFSQVCTAGAAGVFTPVIGPTNESCPGANDGSWELAGYFTANSGTNYPFTYDIYVNGVYFGSGSVNLPLLSGGSVTGVSVVPNLTEDDDVTLFTCSADGRRGSSTSITGLDGINPAEPILNSPDPFFLCSGTGNIQIDAVEDVGTGDPWDGSTVFSWTLDGAVMSTSTGAPPPSFNATTTGTYALVVDAGCTVTGNTITIEDITVTVNTSESQPVQCFGADDGEATAVASGGTVYTYLWSNGDASDVAANLECGTQYTVTVTETISQCTATDNVTLPCPPPALTVTPVIDNHESCPGSADGQITANATGGTDPYNFSWSTGSSDNNVMSDTEGGLSAGTISVTVEDQIGCIEIVSADITVSPPIEPNASATPETCGGDNDGEATANPSGGSSTNYEYLWSTGSNSQTIAPLSPGEYTVTVNNVGADPSCAQTQTVTVDPALGMTLTADVTDPTCFDGSNGSIDLTVTGGHLPIAGYNWDSGQTTEDISGLTEGGYCVTVTDANGCERSLCENLVEPPALTITVDITDPTCFGVPDGEATANVLGGTPTYDYAWSTTPAQNTQTASNLGDGSYTVTVTDDNGCFGTETINITSTPAITITANVDSEETCFALCDGEASASIVGGAFPYTYNWSNGSTSDNVSNLCPGNYTVTGTDNAGCQDITTVNIVSATPIDISSTITDPLCFNSNDGEIDLSISGGTPPYDFVWNTGDNSEDLMGLACTGNPFSVTVFGPAPSCSVTETFNLTCPPEITVTINVDNEPSCNATSDGQATVIASGGTIAVDYTYTWSTGGNLATEGGLSDGVYTVTVEDDNGCMVVDQITITEPEAVTATASVIDNVSCFGLSDGEANVVGSGGTTPYTYDWSSGGSSDTESNLAEGVYTVTVFDDNGCQDVDQITITEPLLPLDATATVTDVICNGQSNGSATAIPDGGTPGYNYFWEDGQLGQTAVNLTNGTYSVTITDDNGCTTVTSATVEGPPNFTITTDVIDVSCEGLADGEGSITVTGGNPTYFFNWGGVGLTPASSNNSGLTANTYTVTITDFAGCTTTTDIVIDEPQAITVTANPTNAQCFGESSGSASLTVNGGTAPYEFAWSDGQTTQTATGLAEGTYSYTVSDDNGCISSGSTTIEEPTEMEATITVTDATCGQVPCNGEAAVTSITGGTPPYTFIWSNVETTQVIDELCNDTYNVTITDGSAFNCQITELALVANIGGDTVDVVMVLNESCPGEADGSATVVNTCYTPGCSLEWFDAGFTSLGVTTNTITGLSAGTYYVELTNGVGCTDIDTVEIQPGLVIDVVATVTNVDCNGNNSGAIDITPSGGTSYTYLWSNGETTQNIANLIAGVYVLDITATDGISCANQYSYTVTEPADVLDATNTAFSDATCNGDADGTASVSPPYGGTAPYTFSWNNGQTTALATGLVAGTYTVTITDGNLCTAVSPMITISEPDVVATTITGDNVTCFGLNNGSANIIVSGGTAPYSYSWNSTPPQSTDNAINLPVGVYNVTVTGPGGICPTTETITITSPEAITLTTDQNNPSCFGFADGDATVNASGGVPAYNYLWDINAASQITPTAGSLIEGVYVVTVSDDNGCEETASVTLTQPTALTITADVTTNFNGEDVSCNGLTDAEIEVIATGGTTDYSYQWGASAGNSTLQVVSNVGAGVYDVTVTDDNLCVATASVTVTEPDVLSITVTVSASTCNNSDGESTVIVTGGLTPYTFSWSNLATTSTITGLFAGSYDVTVSDINGCENNGTALINDIGAESVTVTPQDVSCFGLIDGEATASTLCLTPVCNFLWSDGQTTTTATGLSAGVYILTLTNGVGCRTIESTTITEPDELIANETITNVDCFGNSTGSIALAVTGGQSVTYDYTWNTAPASGQGNVNNVTNLPENVYEVVVTDQSIFACSITFNLTITQPDEIILSTTVSDILCNGASTGIINATISGGVTPYTFLWNSSETTQNISGIPQGVYTLTVTDDQSCSADISSTVSEPTALSVDNITMTPVSCFGGSNGSITVDVSGGLTPYNYLWSDGQTGNSASNLIAGVYIVTVFSNSAPEICFITESITVTEPTAPISSTITENNVSCNGGNDGNATVSVSGGTVATDYQYLWSAFAQTTATATGLNASSFSVTITDDNSCVHIDAVTITQPSSISVTWDTVGTFCLLDNGMITVTPSGGTGTNYTYTWAGSVQAAAQTTQVITGLPSGLYDVTVSDENGCDLIEFDIPIIDLNGPSVQLDNVIPPSCNGLNDGSIFITAFGGTSPYTFVWNPIPDASSQTTEDAVGVSAGNFQVIVTDASTCINILNVSVSEPDDIDATFVEVRATCGTCDGELTVVPTGGVGNYQYAWSNNGTGDVQTNLCAGLYEVDITDDNGCVSRVSSGLSNIDGPSNYTLTVANPSCFGAQDASITIDVTGGTTPYTYLWNPSGQTTATATGLDVRIYTVEVTDAINCKLVVDTLIGNPPQITDSLSVIPPSCGDSNGELTVFLSGGVPGYTLLWGDGSSAPNLTGLPEGPLFLTVTDATFCTQEFTFFMSGSTSPLVSTTVSDVLCFGESTGAATGAASGGTPGYTFEWFDLGLNSLGTGNSVVGLAQGTYILQVEDNVGCIAGRIFDVNEPTPILFSAPVSRPTSCFGSSDGGATSIPVGGVNPYSYQWDVNAANQTTATIVNLSEGIYYLTLTDNNNCEAIDSVRVTQPTEIVIDTIALNSVYCSQGTDGRFELNVSGGTAPYTYLWSNGVTADVVSGLAAGTYCVTVTDDNGCSNERCFIVGGPQIVSLVPTAASCFGYADGSVDLTVLGANTPFTYLWNPAPADGSSQLLEDVSGLLAGGYNVEVTDTLGCVALGTVTVGEADEIDATFTKVEATCGECNGELTAVATGGNSNYGYTWSNGGVQVTQTAVCAGVYQVSVFDTNGCSNMFDVGLGNIGGPDSYTVTITNPSCFAANDGVATITASGGTTPYTYLWLPSSQTTQTAVNLNSISYLIEVTDANNCKLIVDTIVDEPSEIVRTFSSSPTTCGTSDGTLDVSVSGGVSPYTYDWSFAGETTTLITGLPEGVFYLTVTDDTGCEKVFFHTINGSDAPVILIDTDDALCFGSSDGAATATVSGGVSPYSLQWYHFDGSPIVGEINTNINNLVAGDYYLQVIDNTIPDACLTTSNLFTINEPLVIQFSAPVALNPSCFNTSDGEANVIPSGGTLPYTFIWDANTGNQIGSSAQNLAEGVYYATVTDANGCSNIDSVRIVAPSVILIDTISSLSIICSNGNSGELAILASGGAGSFSYLWSNGETTDVISGLAADTYCVTVTDANGCFESACFIVGGPIIDAITPTDLSCFESEDGSIDLTVSGDNVPFTFVWSNGAIFEDITNLSIGDYFVTVTDTLGCFNVTSTSISQPTTLIATFDTTMATCGTVPCNGAATIFVTGGTSPYSYNWASGGNSDNVSGLCAAVHQVEVRDNNNCLQLFSVGISNIGGPESINVNIDDVICFGQSNGEASVITVTGGTSPYIYSWTGSTSTTETASNLIAGQYFVQVLDQNSCLLVEEVIVDQPDAIIDNASIIPTLCGDSNGEIVTNVSGGAGTAYVYLWSNGETTSSISGLPTNLYLLTITDENNCPEEFNYNLNPSNTEIMVVSLTDASCFAVSDGTVSISISNPDATTYNYVWSNDPSIVTITAGDLVLGSGFSAGTYTVSIVDNNLCLATQTIDIEQPAQLLLNSAVLSPPGCGGGSDGGISVVYVGGSLPYNYNWGTTTGSEIINLPQGNYTVSVTDANGCLVSDNFTLTEPTSIEVDTLLLTKSLCATMATGSIGLDASGGTPPYGYNWSNGTSNSLAENLSSGIYTVTVSDTNECNNILNIEVLDSILINVFNVSDTAICENQTNVFLSGTGSVNPSTVSLLFAWVQDSDTLSFSNEVFVNPTLGTNLYTFVAYYQGCYADSTIKVLVNSLPDVDAGEDEQMIINATRELGGNPTSNIANIFSWSPAEYLNDSTVSNPSFNPGLEGVYTIYVDAIDDNGCIARDSVIINVIPVVNITDIFTPNNDGVNDFWIIPFLEQYPNAEVEVYNRWGQLLFKSDVGYTVPWDGTFNGKPLPIGTYYYVILLNHPDIDEPITGPITIVR